jgi:membrane protease YdiL (CAAX protease family)
MPGEQMQISLWKVAAVAFVLIMGPEIFAIGIGDVIQNHGLRDSPDASLAKLLSFSFWLPMAYLVFRSVVGTREKRDSHIRSYQWVALSIFSGLFFLLFFNLLKLSLSIDEINTLNERVANYRIDFQRLTIVSAITFIVVGNVVAPVFEEIVYRGILSGYLSKRYGVIAGFLVSAALFATVHPSRFAFYLLFGLCSSALFHRSGKLATSVTFHVTYNSLITFGALWW